MPIDRRTVDLVDADRAGFEGSDRHRRRHQRVDRAEQVEESPAKLAPPVRRRHVVDAPIILPLVDDRPKLGVREGQFDGIAVA